MLITQNLESLLPTIVSRCQIVQDQKNPLNPNTEKIKDQLLQILTSSPGERILLSKNHIKTKEDAYKFLDNLIIFLDEALLNDRIDTGLTKKEIAEIISKTVSAKRYLDSNVNFKAAMDILFLGFPIKSLDCVK